MMYTRQIIFKLMRKRSTKIIFLILLGLSTYGLFGRSRDYEDSMKEIAREVVVDQVYRRHNAIIARFFRRRQVRVSLITKMYISITGICTVNIINNP